MTLLAALQQRYASLLPYLLLPLLAWQLDELPPRLLPAAGALCGVALWLHFYRQYRHVADTPTTTSQAAAQGYCECFGEAAALDGPPLVTPFGGMRCVWYQAERRPNGRQQRPQRSERLCSDDSFRLLDRRGEIIVQPAGASIEARHQRSWHDGDDVLSERWIAIGDPLYALGELRSLGGQPDRQAFRDDLQLTLNEWKQDPAQLLRRFDQNGDGTLSSEEWEHARQTAHGEVGRNHRALAAIPLSHHLQRPADRRPFIISWRSPQDTAGALRRLAWSHAACALLATLWLVRSG